MSYHLKLSDALWLIDFSYWLILQFEQCGISVFSHLLPKPLGNFEQSNLEVFFFFY